MTTPRFLTVMQVAKLYGLKRGQIANLARRGRIPGAVRGPDGVHFQYPDTTELRKEAKAAKTRSLEAGKRLFPPSRALKGAKEGGVGSPHAVRQQFDFWRREIGDRWETLPPEQIEDLHALLLPIAELVWRLERSLRASAK